MQKPISMTGSNVCCPKTEGPDHAAVTAIPRNGKAASPPSLSLHDKEDNHDER